MEIQFKNHSGGIEVKKEKDDGALSIRAYALAFGNIDSYGDIIRRALATSGCFLTTAAAAHSAISMTFTTSSA